MDLSSYDKEVVTLVVKQAQFPGKYYRDRVQVSIYIGYGMVDIKFLKYLDDQK